MNATRGRRGLGGLLVVAGLATMFGGSALAQRSAGGDQDCQQQNWGDNQRGFCEVREYTVPAAGAVLSVDAEPNGGIKVDGSQRADILVRARVLATARTEEQARAIAARVQVTATADHVSADGPRGLSNGDSWQVTYIVSVPTGTPLSLRTTNGGINIEGVGSRVEFATVNGGVKLARMSGDVEGKTSNGGVDVDLDGATWQGTGLKVQTTNGGVRVKIPENYSAHLETGTVNGTMNIDFPVTVQGRLGRSFSSDLGGGGPTLRITTSNGGVTISRK
jgi:hypothetical protein